MRPFVAVAAMAALLTSPALAASPLTIVAAENFYGDIAQQIGGPDVKVTSILSNPDQDPHLFEASPSVARALSGARIVIFNGIDYDPWMEKLLRASKSSDREEIVVADLIGKKSGENPHIWYDPHTMLTFAKALTDALIATDPANNVQYTRGLATFQASLEPILEKTAALKVRLSGVQATATEPVFGYMFAALGMQVRNEAFQLAVMNDTEPSASEVASFEDDLKNHKVELLVYNSQAANPISVRMKDLARASKIPIVGAAETEPAGKTYQAWMASELDAVDKALPYVTQ